MTPTPDALSIHAAAAEHPDRLFLLADGEAWSFARVADAVARRTLPPGSGAIETTATSEVDTVLDLLAAFEHHRAVVVLHDRWSDAERETFLQDARRGTPPAPDSLAILATSGSSGHPKGVELARRAFLASAAASERRLGWPRSGDRWLLSLSLAHIGGLSILTRCLIARQAIVLPPPTDRFEAAEVAGWIDAWGVTVLSLVPTQLRRLLDLSWRPPSGLRVLLGGAATSPALLAEGRQRGFDLRPTYGMTEACSQVATAGGADDVGVGRPLDGIELRIVAADSDSDGVGAIAIRGATLMRGYRPAPRRGTHLDPDGWWRTGDLGRIDDDGCLQVLGRADDVILSGGENIHPRPVEVALEAVPEVARACVVGLPDDHWGQCVVAAVESADGSPIDAERVLDQVRSRLSRFRVPRRLIQVESMPSTASGKLDRQAVRHQLQNHIG